MKLSLFCAAMIALILLTGCSGVPVDSYSTQAELKDVMRDAGMVIPDRPVYGFVRLVEGERRIQVWENNPKGYWCIVEHEMRHINEGKWHGDTAHDGCG